MSFLCKGTLHLHHVHTTQVTEQAFPCMETVMVCVVHVVTISPTKQAPDSHWVSIMELFSSTAVLKAPDFSSPFALALVVCDVELGAVLLWFGEHG